MSVNSFIGAKKYFKVFDTSLLLMDNMKNTITSNANEMLNNLSAELPEIFNCSTSTYFVVTKNIEQYITSFGQNGGHQALVYDAIFYTISNFDAFLSFIKETSVLDEVFNQSSNQVLITKVLKEDLNKLKISVSFSIGETLSEKGFIITMVEFMIKEKDPKVIAIDLPAEISFIAFKIKQNRNSGRGNKRRILACIYSKIFHLMIKDLYDKSHVHSKDHVAMDLPTERKEIEKESSAFKDVEAHSREEMKELIVVGKNNDKPKPKFDLSLLNEEEQTMKDALNSFMRSYGNRYVYESEAKFIVHLLNKVTNNSISLQQLKAALV